jgi:hypothetical protein
MSWTAVATELRAKDFLARLKAAEDRTSKKQYKRLLATTVAQVLALHPEFDLKKACRRAEKAAGALPVKRLLKSKKRAAAAGIAGAAVLKAVKGTGVRKRRVAAARPRPHEDESPPPPSDPTP